jgi:hypothetical protein
MFSGPVSVEPQYFARDARAGVVALVPGAGEVEEHRVEREGGAFAHLVVAGEVGEHADGAEVDAQVDGGAILAVVAGGDFLEPVEQALAGGLADLAGVEALAVHQVRPFLGGEKPGGVHHQLVVPGAAGVAGELAVVAPQRHIVADLAGGGGGMCFLPMK